MTDDSEDDTGWERPPALPLAAGFVEVRDGEGRLLFLFDPARDLVQVRQKGRTSLIDLRMYRVTLRGAQGKVI